MIRLFARVGRGALALLLLALPARAQAPALATPECNLKVKSAELVECKRKEGVLTVKMRFTAGAEKLDLGLECEETYVVDVASGKKYEVLRDSDRKALAASPFYSQCIHAGVAPGESYKAWWKFPAPPPETKKVTFLVPGCEPMEDVPITDAP